MRHIILPILLLALVLSFCLFSTLYVSSTIEETNAYLTAAVEAYQKQQLEQTEQSINLASSLWSQRQFFFGMVLKHDEVDQVSGEFARLSAYAHSDDGDDFLSNCAALQATLRHIREMEWPSLQNIL